MVKKDVVLKRKSEIHICLQTGGGHLESFTGSDGRQYARIWKVFRVIYQNPTGHFLYINLNGKQVILDPTCPTFVNRLPTGSVPVPDETAEKMHNHRSHYWVGYGRKDDAYVE